MANQIRTAEHRRHARHPITGKVRVLWDPGDGESRICLAELVEVSESGLRIRVDTAITPRSYVTINHRESGIMGRGSVRFCRFIKGKYSVGLEFVGGTGWHPPEAA